MGSMRKRIMDEDPPEEREGRGRSEKKRAARAVDALAVRLVEASAALCDRLPMPDDLREELNLARRITAHGGRKRQMKRVGALLRRDEATATAARAALDNVGRQNRAERNFFHHIEELRDGLCDPDQFSATIETAANELPGLDRRAFTRLAKKVHATGDKRSSREIFRRLRKLAEDGEPEYVDAPESG